MRTAQAIAQRRWDAGRESGTFVNQDQARPWSILIRAEVSSPSQGSSILNLEGRPNPTDALSQWNVY